MADEIGSIVLVAVFFIALAVTLITWNVKAGGRDERRDVTKNGRTSRHDT